MVATSTPSSSRCSSAEISCETDPFANSLPLGYAGGAPNLYQYVGDDPLANSDPTGKAGSGTIDRATLDSLIDQYYQSHKPAKDGDCIKIPVAEFFNWVGKKVKTDDNLVWINRCISTHGCVGVCSVYCQNCTMPPGLTPPDIWNPRIPDPVTFEHPKCFLDQKLAEDAAKKCPPGTHGFVWAKQGVWKDGKPTLGAGDLITNPQDLGSWDPNNPGGFNYISDIGDYYVGADADAATTGKGYNSLTICPKKHGPPLLDQPPHGGKGKIGTMWCATCVKDK
jgi:hypothetical protein